MPNIPDILLLKLAKGAGGSSVGAYTFKGSVGTYDLLPHVDNEIGDIYDVQDTGMNYAWTGTAWDSLGQIVDTEALVDEVEEEFSDVLRYSAQNLTDAQKEQARENIDAIHSLKISATSLTQFYDILSTLEARVTYPCAINCSLLSKIFGSSFVDNYADVYGDGLITILYKYNGSISFDIVQFVASSNGSKPNILYTTQTIGRNGVVVAKLDSVYLRNIVTDFSSENEYSPISANLGRKLASMLSQIEMSTKASVAHTTGSYFILSLSNTATSNCLYIATTDIAIGDTITPGTNCEVVSVGGELNKIKNNIVDEVSQKQDILSFDSVPTASSSNPVTSDGLYIALNEKTNNSDFSDLTDRVDALEKQVARHIYGFHIDSSESDPSDCVTYLQDAIGMTPAAMNFTTGAFSYGSWANTFFLPRPCMLNYDGTVAYYLDPDDYTKKADGVTASDVADDTFAGNAMMEWGRDGKKIWYKIVPDTGDNTSASVYIADYQADSDYRAWSFINNQGDLVDHFYTPIYNGSIDGSGRLRSISGKAYGSICQSKTVAQEIAAAELNNPGTDELWYTEVYADVVLINLMLILMGKSLNTQAVYGGGWGNQANAASSMLSTGTMDDKGLFYGTSAYAEGVKVFGMENWWGNQYRRYAGEMTVDGVHKYKMTRGTQDGSEAGDYNLTGTGYISGATVPLISGTYIMKMAFNRNGYAPSAEGGTTATYWCDMCYTSTSSTCYPLRGGEARRTANNGAFMLNYAGTVSSSNWYMGAAPSCKPMA